MRSELRHTVDLVLGTGATAALAIVYSSITARLLGKVQFGDVAVCLSLIMAAQTAFGPINGIVSRFTAEYAAGNSWGKVRTLYAAFTRRVFVWGSVGGVVHVLIAPWLRDLFQLSSVWLLHFSYAILVASLWLSVGRGTLRGAQAFVAHNVNTILEAAVRLTSGFAIVWFWPASLPALWGYLIALLVTLAYTPVQMARLWTAHAPQPIDGGDVRRFAWPMLGLMLITAGFQNVDMLYVKNQFSAGDAGIYGAAFTLTRLMAVLVTPFNVVLLPILTARHAGGRPVHGSLLRQCLYFLMLAAPPLALFIVWPAGVVHLFSPGYEPAAELLGELAIVRLLGHLCHMVALAGAAVGDFRFLVFYAPFLAAQIAVMVWMGGDLGSVIRALLVVHAVMAVAFGVYVVMRLRG